MTNEHGVKLDSNGYAPSILQHGEGCFLCGKSGLNRHEVFFGSLYRQRSKALGCWVNLCMDCHRAVHTKNPQMDKHLKQVAQMEAMEHYNWSFEDFRKRFGKSYVYEEEQVSQQENEDW